MWAQSVSNGSTGGEGIRPLTPDEALDVLEREGATEAIEKHFAETLQDA